MRRLLTTEAARKGGLYLVSPDNGAVPHLTTRSALRHCDAHEDDDSRDLVWLQPPRYFEPAPDADWSRVPGTLPDAYALEALIDAEEALGDAGVPPRMAR